MYSINSLLHQVSRVLGEEAPPKSLACTSGGPVSHRSTRVSARVGLGILHRTLEHSQNLQSVATEQEAEGSQVDPSSLTFFPSQLPSSRARLQGTCSCTCSV